MKGIIKRIALIFLFAYIFVSIGELWRYLLVDDTDSFTRIMMHQLYSSDENIDVIFVGSSHVYRSLIPAITDEGFECYTFNAGTSAQQMDGSLAIIKEAAKSNDLEHIYLELYYGVAQTEDYVERTTLTPTYIISDYMKFSLNKIEYLMKASSKKYWINSFVIARRNWQEAFEPNYIKDILIKKNVDAYRNYEYCKPEGASQYYVDRGFVACDETIDEEDIMEIGSANGVGKTYDLLKETDWEKSLREIVAFCKKKEIEITFFITPEPEETLVATGDYAIYHESIERISDELEIEFYDFNLCKDEVFDTNNHNFFMDKDHLNTQGAEKFSRFFSDFFTGKYTVDEALYSNFDEKITDKSVGFYGIVALESDENQENRGYRIVSGNPDAYQYKIIVMPKEGKTYTIQEFDSNLNFELPIDESGLMTIVWESLSNRGELQMATCSY